jgi:gluconate 2-dehydrogenase gamma chain
LTPDLVRRIVERMLLSRRDLLDLAVRASALPGAAEFFSAWLRAAPDSQHAAATNPFAPPEPPLLRDYQPKFFGAEDFAALQAFTEILIPTDDTPGAREAHCAHYIDFVLQAATDVMPDLQQEWRDALSALRETGFHAADAQGRAALVEAMSRPERDRAATHPAYGAYRLIKQQNTFAFYTSRAGMIETLDYRGNSFNASFPACTHPEHHTL